MGNQGILVESEFYQLLICENGNNNHSACWQGA